MWRWLQHAFAVEPPGPYEPTGDERDVVERLCREIAKRRLDAAALFFLESSRPLNYVGAQTLHFFSPIVSAVCDADGVNRFARFLEHRGAVDYLCNRLEALRREYDGAPPTPDAKDAGADAA